jgi:MoxR-like ATPase
MSSSVEDRVASLYHEARQEIAKVIIGQDEPIEQVLVCLLAGGHALIEGIPGTAKTLLVRVLARLFDCTFKRIQFTPDLMPADIIGTNIYVEQRQEFQFRPGPLFTQFLLGDEVNRAPAKTQSALLEAMQERQVSVDGTSHALPAIFSVFCTQNPIEQEGTYPLPEAELDRFMMKVKVSYPALEEEISILRTHPHGPRVDSLDPFALRVLGNDADLLEVQRHIQAQAIREELLAYIARVIRGTRDNLKVEVGASPRSGLMLLIAAKARAALYGRGHVLPDDVKALARPVLRHRLVLKPGAEVDGFTTDDAIDEVLARTDIPR